MINVTSIEFFKTLIQYDYDNHHYDFHNDYNCEKISYANGILLILLKSLIDGAFSAIKFTEAKITTMDFFNMKEVDCLTLDNLYRGRAESNGKLIDVSEEGSGYFYLEFYEGPKLEFWAKGMSMEHIVK